MERIAILETKEPAIFVVPHVETTEPSPFSSAEIDFEIFQGIFVTRLPFFCVITNRRTLIHPEIESRESEP